MIGNKNILKYVTKTKNKILIGKTFRNHHYGTLK